MNTLTWAHGHKHICTKEPKQIPLNIFYGMKKNIQRWVDFCNDINAVVVVVA